MMREPQLTHLPVVIVAPNENDAEVDVVRSAVDELNIQFAHERLLHFDVRHWKTHAGPGLDVDGPAGIIGPALEISKSALVVGIFWRRLGSPKGSESEVDEAVARWRGYGAPDVALYFNKAPAPSGPDDAGEQARLAEFRRRMEAGGICLADEFHTREELAWSIRTKLSAILRKREPFRAEFIPALRELENAGAHSVAFSESGDPERASAYDKMRSQASASVLILGVGMTELSNHNCHVLRKSVEQRRSVRLLMLDPEVFASNGRRTNGAHRLGKDFFESYFARKSYVSDLTASFNRLAKFVREHRRDPKSDTSIEFKVYNRLVPLNVTVIDEKKAPRGIMEFCLPFSNARTRFSFESGRRGRLVGTCVDSVEKIWSDAREVVD